MVKPLRKLLTFVFAIVTITVVDAVFVYRTISTSNTNLTHFDTIIVLGTPANPDGTPSPEQRERTLEGVREYKAGIAPNLILTGGPTHNQYVEAHVMAALAIAQGVPENAVIEEGQAQNTLQNIFYSNRIMQDHHWTSAEVVSSPSHLPRTALILQHYGMAWRTHATPWPAEYNLWQRAAHFAAETEYCLRLRLFGFPATHFLPNHAQASEPISLRQP
jgi:uncharacterized SAM-binding protein YcdF (DUF218 family)